MNFWVDLGLPQVCLGLHMLPWTGHLQQTSGGSVAQPRATVSGSTAKQTYTRFAKVSLQRNSLRGVCSCKSSRGKQIDILSFSPRSVCDMIILWLWNTTYYILNLSGLHAEKFSLYRAQQPHTKLNRLYYLFFSLANSM